VDWVDQAGNTYDAVGNFSSRFFNLEWDSGRSQAAIDANIEKADFVPVDVSQFTPAQTALVQQYIQQFGPQVFLVGQ
jgi:hypothetical protein